MRTTRSLRLDARFSMIRFLLLLLLSLPLSALANTQAATVIAAQGDSLAIGADGETRPLARRSAIYVGDTLKTGADALLQLRFSDKAMMTLRAGTEFQIESYANGEAEEPGSAVMELVTGGFRTITGSIGKAAGDTYKVTTPTASIGVRGTHYEALLTPDQQLLVGVLEGGIQVRTGYGDLSLGRGMAYSYSRVARGKPPQGLNRAPRELREPPQPGQAKPRPPRGDSKESGPDKRPPPPDSNRAPPPEANRPPPPDDNRGPAFERIDFADTETRLERPPGSEDESPGDSGPTDPEPADPEPADPEPDGPQPTNPEPADPEPADPEPTGPEPTNPEPADPEPADPEPTGPEPTNPEPADPEPTDPVPADPEPAVTDPRLSASEGEQLQTLSTLGTLVIAGPAEKILATLIASETSVPFDYAANGAASFDLDYFYGEIQTGTEVQTVNVVLSSRIDNLPDLIADINDDLDAAGAPVRARESQLHPGRLEFYTDDGDSKLQFGLLNYQTTNSEATIVDLTGTLGGVQEGSFGHGEKHQQMPQNAAVVFDNNGEPSFVMDETERTETETAPRFVDTTLLERFDVGRRGQALEGETNTSVGGRSNISWGYWSASASTPVHVYEDPDNPDVFVPESDSVYWLSAEAANTADLTGTATFAATGDFLGSGSEGAVDALSGAFEVDFETGSIRNGALGVSTTGNDWSVNFSGLYQNAQAIMKVDNGNIVNGLASCLSCVEGDLSGIFVAPGDAFAGGFNLRHTEDSNVHVEGLMLMEKQ